MCGGGVYGVHGLPNYHSQWLAWKVGSMEPQESPQICHWILLCIEAWLPVHVPSVAFGERIQDVWCVCTLYLVCVWWTQTDSVETIRSCLNLHAHTHTHTLLPDLHACHEYMHVHVDVGGGLYVLLSIVCWWLASNHTAKPQPCTLLTCIVAMPWITSCFDKRGSSALHCILHVTLYHSIIIHVPCSTTNEIDRYVRELIFHCSSKFLLSWCRFIHHYYVFSLSLLCFVRAAGSREPLAFKNSQLVWHFYGGHTYSQVYSTPRSGWHYVVRYSQGCYFLEMCFSCGRIPL